MTIDCNDDYPRSAGIRPATYRDSRISAIYRADNRPEIEFPVGDPDEGQYLVLALVGS